MKQSIIAVDPGQTSEETVRVRTNKHFKKGEPLAGKMLDAMPGYTKNFPDNALHGAIKCPACGKPLLSPRVKAAHFGAT